MDTKDIKQLDGIIKSLGEKTGLRHSFYAVVRKRTSIHDV